MSWSCFCLAVGDELTEAINARTLESPWFHEASENPGDEQEDCYLQQPLVTAWWPGLAEDVDGHGDLRHHSEQVPAP